MKELKPDPNVGWEHERYKERHETPSQPISNDEKQYIESKMNEPENQTHNEKMKALVKAMRDLWG